MTQHEKILNIMATDPDRWWLPQDFMQPELGSNFVGYEASARLSELAKMGEVESRREGKYMARKLIVKNELKAAPTPPPAEFIPTQQTLVDLPPKYKPGKGLA